MTKHIINFLVASALMGICYYYGSVLGAAYDNTNDYKDVISIGSGLGSLIYLIKKYA
jgi:hypothetical protein